MLVGTFAVQVKSKSLLIFWNCKTFWLDTLDFLIDDWGQSKTLNFKQVDEYESVGYQVICEVYWNKKKTWMLFYILMLTTSECLLLLIGEGLVILKMSHANELRLYLLDMFSLFECLPFN